MPVIAAENLTFIYSEGTPLENTALKDICFSADKGEIVGVIGHTGSGKSTLIQHFNGLVKPSKGKMLVLDSDGSHNPIYIPDIYNKYITGYDVVIGSRYTKGGKTEDKVTSRIMSHILNGVFRIVTGVKAKDLSTNFRMYRADVLREIKLTSTNYDVLEEVLLLMKLKIGKGFKVGEIPITFNKRIAGESKRRLIPFIISYIKTMFRLIGIRIKGA